MLLLWKMLLYLQNKGDYMSSYIENVVALLNSINFSNLAYTQYSIHIVPVYKKFAVHSPCLKYIESSL